MSCSDVKQLYARNWRDYRSGHGFHLETLPTCAKRFHSPSTTKRDQPRACRASHDGRFPNSVHRLREGWSNPTDASDSGTERGGASRASPHAAVLRPTACVWLVCPDSPLHVRNDMDEGSPQ